MIRFFCHVEAVDPRSWSKLALSYIKALHKAGSPVRTVPLNIVDFSAGYGVWESVLGTFGVTGPEALNVICAPIEEVGRYWTKGLPNLLILRKPPHPENEKAAIEMARWDRVFLPEMKAVAYLRANSIEQARRLTPGTVVKTFQDLTK